MPAQQQQQQQQQPQGSYPATLPAWPDVGGAGGLGDGLYVPEGSSMAAAAAAAGVGAGPGQQTTVYTLLLETVLALATDPSPRVARLGRRVLGLAQMELAPLAWAAVPAPSVTRSASGAAGAGLSPSSSLGGSAGTAGMVYGSGGMVGANSLASAGGSSSMGASLGSLTSKLVKGGRSWRSGFATGAVGGGNMGHGGVGGATQRPGGPGGAAAGSAMSSAASMPGSAGGSPPGSPTGKDAAAAAAAAAAAQMQAFARQQYILRSTAPEQQQQQQQQQQQMGDAPDGSASGMGRASSGGTQGSGGGADELSGRGGLPPSVVYAAACEYFSRPMLEPQASAWRELEAHKLAPWTALQDGGRKGQRLREMEAARARCRGATNPRLREQVSSIETGADSLTSLVFHSFHLLLVTADARGYLRVQNAADGSMLNTFHAANGEARGGDDLG
jgi:hypothetical protein